MKLAIVKGMKQRLAFVIFSLCCLLNNTTAAPPFPVDFGPDCDPFNGTHTLCARIPQMVIEGVGTCLQRNATAITCLPQYVASTDDWGAVPPAIVATWAGVTAAGVTGFIAYRGYRRACPHGCCTGTRDCCSCFFPCCFQPLMRRISHSWESVKQSWAKKWGPPKPPRFPSIFNPHFPVPDMEEKIGALEAFLFAQPQGWSMQAFHDTHTDQRTQAQTQVLTGFQFDGPGNHKIILRLFFEGKTPSQYNQTFFHPLPSPIPSHWQQSQTPFHVNADVMTGYTELFLAQKTYLRRKDLAFIQHKFSQFMQGMPLLSGMDRALAVFRDTFFENIWDENNIECHYAGTYVTSMSQLSTLPITAQPILRILFRDPRDIKPTVLLEFN